ncbi:metallophosphoesterase [Aquirufa aurantiipilula]|uniref:metallophosphoesterase n=1 Tax=Aquirufa aurantiipilula TaxID=2696561 RepID=UPI001CAA78E3|nr:metallophosphoesterase [Aquirufa aurantiipilula]MBZ1326159.1 metallophosphoesterase [Aquirufa aurantiipilula]
MNKLLFIPIMSLVILAIDYYVWQAFKTGFQQQSQSTQQIIRWVYWTISASIIFGIIGYNFLPLTYWNKTIRTFFMASVMITVVSKLFVVIFLFIEDITRIIRWAFTNKNLDIIPGEPAPGQISRSEFLSKTALVVGAVPAATFTFGILSGAHDYRVEKISLKIPNLPKAFDGLRIAQLSDIHSGSFYNKRAVQGGVDMVMKEKADLLFFTGDLVNNEATEVEDYFQMFSKLHAPMGVYSTLGNHDYGDYVRWKSPQAKKQNLQDLMKAHELMGWNLMMDENKIIEESGEKLALIGVQNIGVGRFPWYGNLAKAHQGTEEASTKLLLSHDPTHWNAEVTKKYHDIDVAFAGHTHGTQFGVKVGDFKWSPAQYVYKQWAGLYQEGKQQLYVNRGFGYIGYPGRVGMPPEISVFTLTRG